MNTKIFQLQNKCASLQQKIMNHESIGILMILNVATLGRTGTLKI